MQLSLIDVQSILAFLLICIQYTQDGQTPLMAAVQEDCFEAARVLVKECNCNINAKNKVRCSECKS